MSLGSRILLYAFSAVFVEMGPTSSWPPPKVSISGPDAPAIVWQTDYAEAWDEAERRGRMLLIYFYSPKASVLSNRFEVQTLGDPIVGQMLQSYVCLKLPVDATVVVDGQESVLLDHLGFREMRRRPGIAIIDFTEPDSPIYGRVVSAFPLTERLCYTAEQMQVILDLPRGTLTQRTLIYAVRTHPDRPESAEGQFHPVMAEEAQQHARYQARVCRQGHQHWTTRFHRINARLGRGLIAEEVCAESWPGQNLVEAAIECVRSWRSSSGHWRKVRALHRVYGYDMKRGTDGIWYATGIFADP